MSNNAADIILNKKEVVCLKLCRGHSYVTESGVKFDKDNPYQIMDTAEAERLMKYNPRKFEFANPEEIKRFYSEDKKEVRSGLKAF